MDVISFQKIFGLGGLECHIVEILRDVTLVYDERRTTEHEDRARILEAEFAKTNLVKRWANPIILLVIL